MWVKVHVTLPEELRTALEVHAKQSFPQECAGLIVLRRGHLWAMPLPVAASSTGFSVEPRVWVEILSSLDRERMDIWASYHSHPGGRPHPSTRDHPLRWTSKRLLILVPRGERIAIEPYEWMDGLDNTSC
ncbi:Mov34/MPN/PAD-1 family protein [Alicyclobacillus fructus]|uniref:Mov34/MPN/PAD-1 family protein n=1 Tax=Alicyclobacillus fructus TaxID=2816082 RepID=UPI001A8FF6EA|nr:Mov34/MPN/PAD-1 family protein [Alicyclobacillus fructus]